MAPGTFYSLEAIETRAQQLLTKFCRDYPETSFPPVPVENIVERYLDLCLLWEPIEEPEGTVILAKLRPHRRQIVLNENHMQMMFEDSRFLYHTVLGHEVGHWELHCKDSFATPTRLLPGFEAADVGTHVSYSEWDEKNAHRFSGCLLMPREWLVPFVRENPIQSLSGLYRLRDLLEVTVTALTVRLDELNLAYIDSDGNWHQNREVFNGQRVLL